MPRGNCWDEIIDKVDPVSVANTPLESRNAKQPMAAGQPILHWLRYIPLSIGAMAMVLGLWTGLLQLGIPLPGGTFPPTELHGALMIAGFLGTVISLERTVAIGHWWAYGAPAVSAAGALALAANFGQAGALAFVFASAIFLVTTASIAFRQSAMFVVVLMIAAACWMAGSVLWLMGHTISSISGWWLDFLILTIAAERLELSRMLRVSWVSQTLFVVVGSLPVIGAARTELVEAWAPFTSAGLIGLAVWLVHHDVARRTIRLPGLPRFSACSILAGHMWLAAAGAMLALASSGAVIFLYDAVIHAIAIGFVMSMIFGHAPIILPAIIGLRVRFVAASYASLALLHLSVLLRLAGDIFGLNDVRAASGILTVLALVSYAAILIAASSRQTLRSA